MTPTDTAEETDVSRGPDGTPPIDAPGAGPLDDFGRVARTASTKIRTDRHVRRNLPGDGRLELDRALPWLALYRRPTNRRDEGTDELATAFSSYLIADGSERFGAGVVQLVTTVAEASVDTLDAFLLIELWTAPDEDAGERPDPSVEVVVDPEDGSGVGTAIAEALDGLALRSVRGGVLGVRPEVCVTTRTDTVAPPGLDPVEPAEQGWPDGVHRIGLEVSAFFRNPSTGSPLPRVLQAFRHALVDSIERALFDFAHAHTSLDPPHPRALARRSFGRAARHVDGRLREVSSAFDPLLQVSPTNTEEAWTAFRDGGCNAAPKLRYRPLPFDPEDLKRRLFSVPIEGVEDPLLGLLFRETQEELDRQITLVSEVGTDRFLPAGLQLYGDVDERLLELARAILERLPGSSRNGAEEYGDDDQPRYVGAEEFADAARKEVQWYRTRSPAFEAGVEIRSDVTAGLMVTSGVLCIGEGLSVPRDRVEALINHEVGTHLVTACNGRHQPIRQLEVGLAGYDPLQEGLAVLSEYLVGGLSTGRMRILAARVEGVQCLLDGADFVETWRRLHEGHGFSARSAFLVTVRIYRGGGLTKDAAYLRGLRDLLAYLRGGGALDPLFVGKLGLSHTETVQELVLRGVLRPPVVKPRYTSDLAAMERLGGCRHMNVMQLVERIAAPGQGARA